jgi:hypothetical protein
MTELAPPPVDLTRLEQLAESATPGVWWSTEAIGDDEDAVLVGVERPGADDGYAIIVSTPGDASFAIEPTNRAADAEFIAALRNAAPQLLAASRAVERVRALCESFDPTSGSGRARAFVNDLRAAIGGAE